MLETSWKYIQENFDYILGICIYSYTLQNLDHLQKASVSMRGPTNDKNDNK